MDKSSLYIEKALFDSIAEGDETAFKTCYAEYGKVLLPFLIRMTGARDSAEEIIQEVFLKLWLHRDRLTEVVNPGNWLFRVAANAARSWLKKKMIIEQMMRNQPREQEDSDNHLPGQIDVKAIAAIVQRTIRELPPQRRLIYQMSREEGLKPAEIAARLGLSVSTVKNTLLSALKAIRGNIEGAGLWSTFLLLFIRK